MTDSPGLLNFENFPCGSLPETHEQMRRAQACPRCRGMNLAPVSDCATPPTLAVACEDCGTIEGDAATLPQAIANWNAQPRKAA
jgi:hypothetical protein